LVSLVLALLVGYGVRGVHGADTAQSPASTGASVSVAPSGSASEVPLSSLPPEVSQTIRLIKQGGPFPYPENDGVVFHNFEHRLPPEPDGYYHEYTVPTPGSPDRGARRLVVGADGRYWYTDNHYESFELVDLSR
jgi:ribonuclease T1